MRSIAGVSESVQRYARGQGVRVRTARSAAPRGSPDSRASARARMRGPEARPGTDARDGSSSLGRGISLGAPRLDPRAPGPIFWRRDSIDRDRRDLPPSALAAQSTRPIDPAEPAGALSLDGGETRTAARREPAAADRLRRRRAAAGLSFGTSLDAALGAGLHAALDAGAGRRRVGIPQACAARRGAAARMGGQREFALRPLARGAAPRARLRCGAAQLA